MKYFLPQTPIGTSVKCVCVHCTVYTVQWFHATSEEKLNVYWYFIYYYYYYYNVKLVNDISRRLYSSSHRGPMARRPHFAVHRREVFNNNNVEPIGRRR